MNKCLHCVNLTNLTNLTIDNNANSNCTCESTEEITKDNIFLWYITNKVLKTVYYYCLAANGSPFPPVCGWNNSSLGLLPCPIISVADPNVVRGDSAK